MNKPKRPINLQEISLKKGQEVMTFPCAYALKVLGKQQTDFDALVVSIIRAHKIPLTEGAVSCRHSKNKRYLSVTVNFTAESRAQLDALYQDLCDHPQIKMVL